MNTRKQVSLWHCWLRDCLGLADFPKWVEAAVSPKSRYGKQQVNLIFTRPVSKAKQNLPSSKWSCKPDLQRWEQFRFPPPNPFFFQRQLAFPQRHLCCQIVTFLTSKATNVRYHWHLRWQAWPALYRGDGCLSSFPVSTFLWTSLDFSSLHSHEWPVWMPWLTLLCRSLPESLLNTTPLTDPFLFLF